MAPRDLDSAPYAGPRSPGCRGAAARPVGGAAAAVVRPVQAGGAAEAAAADRSRAREDRPQEGHRARPDDADLRLQPAHPPPAGQDRRRCRRASSACRSTSTPSAPSSRACAASCAPSAPASLRLRARLDETRRLLRLRLVEIYKAEPPDVVTVILNSDGFTDLLERTEFIRRISDQDRKIVTLVRAAKADSVASEKQARQARGAPAARHGDRPAAPRRDRRREDGADRHARGLHAHEERQGRGAQQRAREIASSSRSTSTASRRRRTRSPASSPRRRASTPATCRSGAATAA